ncbi:hypothetical protein Ancab_015492, partial [Ancistrocladus abbreviatus]
MPHFYVSAGIDYRNFGGPSEGPHLCCACDGGDLKREPLFSRRRSANGRGWEPF